MKVLVINCGSSSLKYQFIDMDGENVLAKGLVERIGIEGSVIKHDTTGKDRVVTEAPMENHKVALEYVIQAISHPEYGAVQSMKEIDAVGHRVVHGGERFSSSVLIDDDVMKAISECVDLAPLHNPPNITGINACRELMKDTPMVAVFDTAFHQTMPKESYIYSLPYEYYEKYKVRRYGFHGTSHRYVTERASELLGISKDNVNLITCHLGNGSSIAAIRNGQSVDTSMGLTPLEGLTMGTRCGDIDPALVTFIMEKENLSTAEMNNVMNKKSGVAGISGISSDFRDLEDGYQQGNEKAKLAIDLFVQKVKKYIGAYYAELGHIDGIVFAGGIGENSGFIREKVLENLNDFGIKVHSENNATRGKELFISTEDSKVPVLVVPTNEELMIARDTKSLVVK